MAISVPERKNASNGIYLQELPATGKTSRRIALALLATVWHNANAIVPDFNHWAY